MATNESAGNDFPVRNFHFFERSLFLHVTSKKVNERAIKSSKR